MYPVFYILYSVLSFIYFANKINFCHRWILVPFRFHRYIKFSSCVLFSILFLNFSLASFILHRAYCIMYNASSSFILYLYLISCILYPVLCILYPVSLSYILYYVSSILYPVSCILYPVSLSYILYLISCILYYVSCILCLYLISCTMYPLSCILYPVFLSYILYIISCILYPVSLSYIRYYVSCILYPVLQSVVGCPDAPFVICLAGDKPSENFKVMDIRESAQVGWETFSKPYLLSIARMFCTFYNLKELSLCKKLLFYNFQYLCNPMS